jgi:hypothetical protein
MIAATTSRQGHAAILQLAVESVYRTQRIGLDRSRTGKDRTAFAENCSNKKAQPFRLGFMVVDAARNVDAEPTANWQARLTKRTWHP